MEDIPPPCKHLNKNNQTVDTEITRVAKAYKEGKDPKSAERLLFLFKPLLEQYKFALWTGVLNKTSRHVRKFLCFFGPDKIKSLQLISKSLHRNEEEDLDQILAYSLLSGALKYNMVAYGLMYELKREVCKITKDPLAQRVTVLECDFDFINTDNTHNFAYYDVVDPDIIVSERLGRRAIESTVASFITEGSENPLFAGLSQLERDILCDRYIKNISLLEISESHGMSLYKTRMLLQTLRKQLRQTIKNTI